jgi:mono/diheme cytochrome c family protein
VRTELSVLLLLAGCGATSLGEVEATLPQERRSDYRVFATNCSKCHGLERALNAHVTSNQHWDLYVARMARTPGSGISPREAPAILSFLHYYTEQKNRARGDEKP